MGTQGERFHAEGDVELGCTKSPAINESFVVSGSSKRRRWRRKVTQQQWVGAGSVPSVLCLHV